ncbi:hypothetical protein [Flagellimonas okinawensis]|uniref:Uncharacterized protein n=1 Tax=Flagellimonas okinawensis TaxID=3031324 RepID=A0ABT5XTJ6_9FLAO|nr:hypothetical protein [[Muricauda] okinawensis]MDF0708896.1 hypothetical protein [[Muricauda] okinawensis]
MGLFWVNALESTTRALNVSIFVHFTITLVVGAGLKQHSYTEN